MKKILFIVVVAVLITSIPFSYLSYKQGVKTGQEQRLEEVVIQEPKVGVKASVKAEPATDIGLYIEPLVNVFQLGGRALESTTTQTVKPQKKTQIRIKNYVGKSEIIQWNESHIEIEFTKKVRLGNDPELEQKIYEALEYEIRESGKELIIETKDISHLTQNRVLENFEIKADYRIYLPKSLKDIDVFSNVGAIQLEGDYTEARLENNVGKIVLAGTTEELIIKNNTGAVEIKGTHKKMDVNTNVGKIGINVQKPEKITAKAVTGAVEATLTDIPKKGTYSFDTTIGNVDITLPAKTVIDIDQKNITAENISVGQSEIKIYSTSVLGKCRIRGV